MSSLGIGVWEWLLFGCLALAVGMGYWVLESFVACLRRVDDEERQGWQ